MTLADLRRLAVRRQIRIRFKLAHGMECVITEHGVARAPELRSSAAPDFEQELSSAAEFVLESAEPGKSAPKPRSVSREELVRMLAPAAAAPHEEE